MNLRRYLFSALCLIQMPSYALNPVQGTYAGVFLGVSYSPSAQFVFQPPISFTGPNASVSAESGSISNSVLGNIGGQIGYRFCENYRVEGEFFYNNNHFKNLTVQNITLTSPFYSLTPPNSITYNNVENSPDAHIQGDRNTGAFMINGFYDFFIPNNDGYSTVVPFVGLGIGYSYVQNALQFYREQTSANVTNPASSREILQALQIRKTYAGQVIGGFHYFLDDFTWFSVDLRYWTTGSSTNPTTQYTLISPTERTVINNSYVNLFGKNTQLYTANLSFNGAFDFG
ncbi:MAG: P44/Msp2 family outer membrane protein [Legionellaceae bacterium]|nr:P44/Msp2 family outer membrane protein [Legionellaceae bacterium]